ncbi:MAG: protease inhibitor I42 family protein [Candidatus Brocadiales bacterium]|nr:protease inhibitor I42 family protein [Candidatus Bathyanammoxibius amoris]
MRPLHLIASVIIIIPLLTSTIACTGEAKKSEGVPAPSETLITQADGGKTFKVRKGGEITIRLKGNRTTGYSWAVEEADKNVLELIKDVYTPDQPVIPGSGGVRTLTFKAVSVDTVPVRLKYWRPWEGNSSAVKRFGVTIQVSE